MPYNKSTIWHPFTQHGIAPDSIHINHAKGAYLYDKNGQRIIDAISSWWVITHGHCHPHIVSAVQAQAEKLDQVIFAGFTHDPAENLAEKLIRHTGEAFDHVFYSDSGSTAVEVALKMALGYWENKGQARQKIIALEHGYHGDTFGAMSAGARSIYNRAYDPFLFEVEHITVPVSGQESASFEMLERVLKANKNNVACFIFEPLLQGAGGMNIYSPEALQTLCTMCRREDVFLIADEIMTGFGRTGSFLACDKAGINPDILCLSKGLTAGFLPMSATLCTRGIYDAFYSTDKSKMFFHSSSFTANPISCSAAVASLEIWENELVQSRIDEISNSHETALKDFKARTDVENVRSLGTMLAFDIKAENSGYLSTIQPQLYDFFLRHNILLRPLGNTVYMLPPYCISKEDLEEIYETLHLALDSLRDERQQCAV
ncbi:MAG: adenosylmethionine--8-amino-7-oxononanoate transaminase [Alphaproteobacteria bacterium]|nr:adenosylmethionine--8-amino-7-oxononanoate transaminase [Alphaproteobacteria bacterium]